LPLVIQKEAKKIKKLIIFNKNENNKSFKKKISSAQYILPLYLSLNMSGYSSIS
jgi:hypothetical protein